MHLLLSKVLKRCYQDAFLAHRRFWLRVKELIRYYRLWFHSLSLGLSIYPLILGAIILPCRIFIDWREGNSPSFGGLISWSFFGP